MSIPEIQISDLEKRHPGVSPGVSLFFAEAAVVCFARYHASPVEMEVGRGAIQSVSASWDRPSDDLLRAWANEIDTTEAAAYCVALASVELTDGLVAVARAETRTGADYYLGSVTDDDMDLETSHRLEVSGVGEGTHGVVQARLRQKISQAAAGRSNLPAIAAVVGFAARRIMIDAVPQE